MSVHAINFELPWLKNSKPAASRTTTTSTARQPVRQPSPQAAQQALAAAPAAAPAAVAVLEVEPLPPAAAAFAEPGCDDLAALLARPARFVTSTYADQPAAAPQTFAAPSPPVTQPQPRRQVAPPAPPASRQRSEIRSPRRQKLATTQIAPGRYGFLYQGTACEVLKTPTGWVLMISNQLGDRRYETKRHAVNAARVYLDKQVAEIREPLAAPAAEPADDARPVNWRDPAAPWRRLAATRKQYRLLRHLRDKMRQVGLRVPADDGSRLTRGAASDLIDSLKAQIVAAAPRAMPSLQTCSLGPFARGFCTVCGLRQASR